MSIGSSVSIMHRLNPSNPGTSTGRAINASSLTPLQPQLPLHKLGPEFFTTSNILRPRFASQKTSSHVPVYDLKKLKTDLLNVQGQPYETRLAVGQALLNDLHEFGAIRVKNHGVLQETVAKVLSNITQILGQPIKALQKFVTNETTNFRGLQIKPNDPKRVFHIGSHNNIAMKGHESLSQDGSQLFQELNDASKDMLEILSLIYEGRPDGVLIRFAFKNTSKAENPQVKDAIMRQIYYPNAKELKRENVVITDKIQDKNVRLIPHLDYGLITVLPASDESGLYILPHSKNKNIVTQNDARKIPLSEWIKLETEPGELLIQIGRQMDIATKGLNHPISATWHTVLADEKQMEKSRSSTAFFVENELEPLPDYAQTLEQGKHVTATTVINGQKVKVDSLYALMGGNAPSQKISQLVPQVTLRNPNLIHLP